MWEKKARKDVFRMLKPNGQSGVLILLESKLFYVIQICSN